jgi:hypothetical protein
MRTRQTLVHVPFFAALISLSVMVVSVIAQPTPIGGGCAACGANQCVQAGATSPPGGRCDRLTPCCCCKVAGAWTCQCKSASDCDTGTDCYANP